LIEERYCKETYAEADGYERLHMKEVLPWLKGWLPNL